MCLDLALAQLHHVLDAFAGVDEADAVILQAERGEGRELLHGRFLVGGLVGEAAERDLGFFVHVMICGVRMRTEAARRRGPLSEPPGRQPDKGRRRPAVLAAGAIGKFTAARAIFVRMNACRLTTPLTTSLTACAAGMVGWA